MVVEFYRDSPEYQYAEAKYIWYYELFEGIENQTERILGHGSNGYGVYEELESLPDTPIPKEEFTYDYFLDDEKVMSISRVVLTLKSEGNPDEVYNNIDDPDNVRFVIVSPTIIYKESVMIALEDGTVVPEKKPEVHAVRFMFNEFPSDHMFFTIEFFDEEKNVFRSDEGIIDIVPAPWEE